MKIGDYEIANGNKPYLIAEISCNHGGSLHLACELIVLAKCAGADAVKFQAYTPETITLNIQKADFLIKSGPWQGWYLHDLYKDAHTPFEWFPRLYEVADEVGITLFASVFDPTSVDMLERLGCPAYKIASMEIVDIPLIRYAASTNKPLIISTGMASEHEIHQAMRAAHSYNNCAMLACVSSYPATLGESGLGRLKALRDIAYISGLSDHSLGDEVTIAATGMGAAIIEKHFCQSRDRLIHDAEFSMEPEEFLAMSNHIKWIHASLVNKEYKSEEASRQFRRSLYAVENIGKGEWFTEKNVRSIRPGYGLPPVQIKWLMNHRAVVDIPRGTALKKEMVK
jgi:pseudaminic acid synthase